MCQKSLKRPGVAAVTRLAADGVPSMRRAIPGFQMVRARGFRIRVVTVRTAASWRNLGRNVRRHDARGCRNQEGAQGTAHRLTPARPATRRDEPRTFHDRWGLFLSRWGSPVPLDNTRPTPRRDHAGADQESQKLSERGVSIGRTGPIRAADNDEAAVGRHVSSAAAISRRFTSDGSDDCSRSRRNSMAAGAFLTASCTEPAARTTRSWISFSSKTIVSVI